MPFSRRAFIAGAGSMAIGAFSRPVFGQLGPSDFNGTKTFERLLALARARKWANLPIGQVVGEVAMALIGTPYVANTLELYEDKEVCVVNLDGLDCATLFEAALAFARMVKTMGNSPYDFVRQVRRFRYRGSHLDGYTSRLHYTSDYFFDNALRHQLELITPTLPGAQPFEHPVNFMSTHAASYRQLKAHPELMAQIAQTEAEINARHTMFLPKEKVAAAEPLLKTGDILGFTTRVAGLDCSHTGLCYRTDYANEARLLHASSRMKKVVLDAEIATYLAGVKADTGIMVARPMEPGFEG